MGRRAASAAARQRGQDLYATFETLEGVLYRGRRDYGPVSRMFVLTDDDGAVIASLKIPNLQNKQLLTIGTTPRYELRAVPSPGQKARDAIIDVESGRVWCRVTGRHYDHRATTRLTRPDGSWIHYPVFGRRQARTVMIAEDQDGAALAYFRKVRRDSLRRTVEIVAAGGRLEGEDLVVMLAVGGAALYRYFEHPSGG